MSNESETLYEKLIYENVEKFYQLKLVVNLFRDTEYVHIRKYFLSFEDGYVPSREGVSFPASMANIFALLDGLMEITSAEENIALIHQYFGEKLQQEKNRSCVSNPKGV